jgi:uncharacterized protein
MNIDLVETARLETKNPFAITGFPDIGLVGTIAVSHIIKVLDLKEIGYLKSESFPPITVVHRNRPKAPVRIYGDDSLLVIISEIPVPPLLMHELSHTIVNWLKEKKISLLTILGGVENPKRLEIKKPGVYGISTGREQDGLLKKGGIKSLEEGFLAGQDGLILRYSYEQNVPSIYLMAESHYGFPDPGAAAAVIQATNKVMGLKVDVKSLLEKEDEIRLLTKELMRRTEENLQSLQKGKEKEVPVMYG